MPAVLVSILTWFAGFVTSGLIAKVAGLIVFSGISQVMVSWLMDQVSSTVSGAPGEVVQLLGLYGVWDVIGIFGGAMAMVLTINAYRVGPSAAVTGG